MDKDCDPKTKIFNLFIFSDIFWRFHSFVYKKNTKIRSKSENASHKIDIFGCIYKKSRIYADFRSEETFVNWKVDHKK